MEQKQVASEEQLRMLIANDCIGVAQSFIDDGKLPYRIEGKELKDALEGTELWLKKFITEDSDTLKMKDDVRKLAKVHDEVLIMGDTGTGKEVIARAMIANRAGSFIVANCAGFPEQLIESELFGYMKGSFTGAEGQRQGMFAAASGGVMFLDEVGELPLSVQAKLLRAIQEKKIRRVGAKDEEAISCKFVFATHRNLKEMVAKQLFREDLYARISTFELHIKPLSERDCDIPAIIESLPGGKKFLDEVRRKELLHKLDLSYNVRSLQQYVKRFTVLGRIDI